MFVRFLKYFFLKKCTHEKVTPQSISPFCPDCGEEIALYWETARCACCSAKRSTVLSLNKAVPFDKFCTKCGTARYYIERKEHLDFFELRFATLVKETIRTDFYTKTQIWVENEENLSSYLKPFLIPSQLTI